MRDTSAEEGTEDDHDGGQPEHTHHHIDVVRPELKGRRECVRVTSAEEGMEGGRATRARAPHVTCVCRGGAHLLLRIVGGEREERRRHRDRRTHRAAAAADAGAEREDARPWSRTLPVRTASGISALARTHVRRERVICESVRGREG